MKIEMTKAIAEAVGCSKSLASMILTGKRAVTTELHRRILAAEKILQRQIDAAAIEIQQNQDSPE